MVSGRAPSSRWLVSVGCMLNATPPRYASGVFILKRRTHANVLRQSNAGGAVIKYRPDIYLLTGRNCSDMSCYLANRPASGAPNEDGNVRDRHSTIILH